MKGSTEITRIKWAVITGASGGIGRALVKTFLQEGYQVIGTDRVPRPKDLLCTEYIQADLITTVNDIRYAEEIFSQINLCLGDRGLDVLINNAAVQILGGIDHLTREDWQTTLNINLTAPFIWIQALLSKLEIAQGNIINISSIHAKLTKPNFFAYATSKAALSGMTRSLALDLGSRVRINAIEPAAIETSLLEAGFKERPDLFELLSKHHPQGRIGTPEEVAAMALMLTKGSMPFLNGCCISLDGGISSRLHDPD